jgi:hypothetical protein
VHLRLFIRDAAALIAQHAQDSRSLPGGQLIAPAVTGVVVARLVPLRKLRQWHRPIQLLAAGTGCW